MKKILLVVMILAVIVALCGCTKEVVSETAINCEYIAAYDTVEATYSYKYDWFNGELKYLPDGYKTVHHEEEYRVQYERVWSDGSRSTYWETVTKEEYDAVLKILEE